MARERGPRGPADTVFVRGLRVRTLIGVEPRERRALQTVVIDLDVACDAAAAARRDDVRDAVNYRTLAKAALAFGARSRFALVETFAERLAALLLEGGHGVSWLRLRVSKPGAVRFSREVGVEIERGRRT